MVPFYGRWASVALSRSRGHRPLGIWQLRNRPRPRGSPKSDRLGATRTGRRGRQWTRRSTVSTDQIPEPKGGSVRIRGAREHNLKDVSLEIPRNALVVFTGVSASGKSSLAFGTLYAEAQRRYLKSMSPYARRLFHQMAVPEVELVEGTAAGGLLATAARIAHHEVIGRKRNDVVQPAADAVFPRRRLSNRCRMRSLFRRTRPRRLSELPWYRPCP